MTRPTKSTKSTRSTTHYATGRGTFSSPSLSRSAIPGGYELHFTLFDHPYTITMERVRPSHYILMLDGDRIGDIDLVGRSWVTPMQVHTRSSDVAAYVTTLWYLLGRERGEL